MKDEYNISKLNPKKNPYVGQLMKQITINLDCSTIEDFKDKAGNGTVLVSEVSMRKDCNRFYDPVGLFPPNQEDESPFRLLCNE